MMQKGVFSPHYFAMNLKFVTLDIIANIAQSHIEAIRNIETAKACQKAAQDQYLYHMAMHKRIAG